MREVIIVNICIFFVFVGIKYLNEVEYFVILLVIEKIFIGVLYLIFF